MRGGIMLKGKALALLMSVCLVFNAFSIDSFASNPRESNPHNAAIKYVDIDEVPWAKNAIDKMSKMGIIKGNGIGEFKPNKPITELEAIVMSIRLAGFEDDALEMHKLISSGKKSVKFKTHFWAYGYVYTAIKEEILLESDPLKNLNASTSRFEVAVYVVRALGLEDEAQDNMNRKLPFKDAKYIPRAYVGHVHVAYDLGLMTTFQNDMFKPYKAATRAEMAVILSRVDEDVYLFTKDYNRYSGTIEKLDYRGYDIVIDVKYKSAHERFDFARSVRVNFNDDKGDLDDLKVGDKVELWVEDDDDVVRIDVERNLYEIVEGDIRRLDYRGDDILIDIKHQTAHEGFDFIDKVEVTIEGDEGDVDDLKVGDQAKVWIDGDDNIVRIDVKRHVVITGKIRRLDYRGDDIVIDIYNQTAYEGYDFIRDVEVNFRDGEGDIDDLKVGDRVKVWIDDGDEVIRIDVERNLYRRVEGDINRLDYRGDDIRIDVKHQTAHERFDFIHDVEVIIEGDEGDVDDLKVGDQVVALVDDNDDIIRIDVERHSVITGEIRRLDYGGDDIVIDVNGQTAHEDFDFAYDVEVNFEDGNGDTDDLKVGDDVEVWIDDDDDVVRIDVERHLLITGEIRRLDYGGDDIVIDIHNQTAHEAYDFSDDVEVNFEDREGDVDDLKVGDQVKVWLDDDDDIMRIDVDRQVMIEGKIRRLDYGGDDIVIDVYGQTAHEDFDFAYDVEVNFEDYEGDIDDLKVGDEVEVWLDEDDDVIRINVDRDLVISGKIRRLDYGRDDIVIDVYRQTADEGYDFAYDVEVNFKDGEGDVDDLEVGDEVEVWVDDDDDIVRIDVDRRLD